MVSVLQGAEQSLLQAVVSKTARTGVELAMFEVDLCCANRGVLQEACTLQQFMDVVPGSAL